MPPLRQYPCPPPEAITPLLVPAVLRALDDHTVATSGTKDQLCDRLLSCRAHERVREASSLYVPALKEAIVAEGGSIGP